MMMEEKKKLMAQRMPGVAIFQFFLDECILIQKCMCEHPTRNFIVPYPIVYAFPIIFTTTVYTK